MTDDEQVEDLGRLSFRTAGQLRLLRERMITLSWQPDGYDPADLGQPAATLHGHGAALRDEHREHGPASCPAASSANWTEMASSNPSPRNPPDHLRRS